jgi:hypothetical protein
MKKKKLKALLSRLLSYEQLTFVRRMPSQTLHIHKHIHHTNKQAIHIRQLHIYIHRPSHSILSYNLTWFSISVQPYKINFPNNVPSFPFPSNSLSLTQLLHPEVLLAYICVCVFVQIQTFRGIWKSPLLKGKEREKNEG